MTDFFSDHSDARLIAAAPDLLDALKQACRILADEGVPDAALHPGDPLLVWKAAIAKAEGKS